MSSDVSLDKKQSERMGVYMINSNETHHDRYTYCASLGWFCGVTNAMGNNGLRFFSGPFDWYFSDYPSVLQMIESNFADFLDKNNLQVVDSRGKEFFDAKYGFYYKHDVKENFEDEYFLIVQKYKRRIDKFMSAIKNPTCFFRAVRDEAEIRYIEENKDYIDRIIKQSNPKNVVVYLLLDGMSAPKDERCFYLNVDQHVLEADKMPFMFDGSRELLDYCENLIDEYHKRANCDYFRNSSKIRVAYLLRDINIREKLSEIFRGKDLYVWGAGLCGVKVESMLVESGIKILGFLDNSEEKKGTCINNITIYKFEDVDNIKAIFISLSSLELTESVINQIRMRNPNIEIYTWSSVWDRYPAF